MTSAKEQEPIPQVLEQEAMQEVEGYIEQVEKAPEIDQDSQLKPAPSQTPTPAPVIDDSGQTVMSSSEPVAPIRLPLTETQVRDGLHHKLVDSFRWLAEYCVYLIKKYPGRVFYNQNE
jgi:hypothetical protein